jgi:hypothetical protein
MERVKSHYENLQRNEIDIPEWDIKAYSTALTLAERALIESIPKRINKDGGNAQDDDYSFNVDTLIVKLLGEDGKPLFSVADRRELLHKADARVISRIPCHIFRSPLILS